MKITAPRIDDTIRRLAYLDGERSTTLQSEGPSSYIEGVAFGILDMSLAFVYALVGGFVTVAMTMAVVTLLRVTLNLEPTMTLMVASLSVAALSLLATFFGRRRLGRWFKAPRTDPARSARRRTLLDTTIQTLTRLRAHFGADLHTTVWPQWGDDDDVIKVRIFTGDSAQDLIIKNNSERLSATMAPVTRLPPIFSTPYPEIELKADSAAGESGWRHPQRQVILRDAPVWLADSLMRHLMESSTSSGAARTANPVDERAARWPDGLRWVTGAPETSSPGGATLDAELSAPGASAIQAPAAPMPASYNPHWMQAGFASMTLPALLSLLWWFGLSIALMGSPSPGGGVLSLVLSLISLVIWARVHIRGWPQARTLQHTARRATAPYSRMTLRGATLSLISEATGGEPERSLDLERPFTMNFYRAASTLQAHLIVELVPASPLGGAGERLRFGVPVSLQGSEESALAALQTLDVEVGLVDPAIFWETLWPELTAYANLHDRRPRWTFMPPASLASAHPSDTATQEVAAHLVTSQATLGTST